jgi:hypothetical protein
MTKRYTDNTRLGRTRLKRLRRNGDDANHVIWRTAGWAEFDGETGDMLERGISDDRVCYLDPTSVKTRLRLLSSQAR